MWHCSVWGRCCDLQPNGYAFLDDASAYAWIEETSWRHSGIQGVQAGTSRSYFLMRRSCCVRGFGGKRGREDVNVVHDLVFYVFCKRRTVSDIKQAFLAAHLV